MSSTLTVVGNADTGKRAHTEHLRQLGLVAAGVAHDLRNIINGMSLRLEYLERHAQLSADDVAIVATLRREVAFGVGILERLCDFARPSTNDIRAAELGPLAHEACELSKMRLTSARAVVAISEAHSPAPPVFVRSADVLSATLNLIINAIDAISEKGEVVVQTGGTRDGGWIQVSDTGPGIPARVREHLFEPVLTTKGRKGCGLGLSQVATCVREHQGKVFVDTRPKHGTVIRLWFPVNSAA